ncbi:hypothetical protein EPA93_03935 [Ktedonosporobacter rubrisoli]|uniref:Uncharacterized protein n=1 Tax=Ktedonosporobacter rubrisoli TaxID=2509675 RepID=A0A4P6JJ97_KTERU|nr:hypothetical protein [Ktedonosporobacter rubrisoli]QBD75187.1 hypothetical protein EPA93_03935 [Ktedonosporobacter rubrisoli]
MSSDPLSQFRRGEQPSASPTSASQNRRATPANTGKKTYEAFDKRGRPSPYLEIRCVLQPSQTPQSRYLMDVVYSADFDDGFTLLYSFMAVEIRGTNLKDVRRAVQSGQCEFIQEYHENEFARPAQAEPVITSVKFITGEKLDDILSTFRKAP